MRRRALLAAGGSCRPDRRAFRDEGVLRRALLFLLALFMNKGIGELAIRSDVYETPLILARQWIDVSASQIAPVAGLLQGFDRGGIFAFFPHIQLYGAAVLESALDQ